MAIVNRIVDLLELKGISQKDFCEKTEIKQQTFSTWKNRYSSNVPAEKLAKIADVLQVPILYLLTGEGDKEIKEPSIQEKELLRIFNSLNVKGQAALLSRAYELEEQNSN